MLKKFKKLLDFLFTDKPNSNVLGENYFTIDSTSLGYLSSEESCKEPISYGTFAFPREMIDTHVMGIGSPGSGKTMMLKMTLSSVLKLCRSGSGIKIVVIDTKGDLLPVAHAATEETKVPLYYINQGDSRSITPSDGVMGYAWDIAKDCQGKANYIQEKLNLIFPVAERDPMWQQAAQLLANGSIVNKLDWQLATIYYFFFSGIEKMKAVLEKTDFGLFIKETIIDSNADKTRDGVIINAISSIYRFSSAAAHQFYTPKDRWLSLKDFINGSEGVLVIGRDSSNPSVSNPLIQAMLKSLIDYIKMRPEMKQKDIFIFIDELPFLGKNEGLIEMLTFERSKGVSAYLTTQSIEALQEIYGDKATDTIASTCGIKIIGLANSPTTAEWCVRLGGKKLVLRKTPQVRRNAYGTLVTSFDSQYLERDCYTTSDFLHIPETNRVNGLHFHFFSSFTDRSNTFYRISPDDVDYLKPPEIKCDFIPLAADKMTLPPLSRLELGLKEAGQAIDNPEWLEKYKAENPELGEMVYLMFKNLISETNDSLLKYFSEN
jgi:Type IV secretion-system coupling protein DNA-binding domain